MSDAHKDLTHGRIGDELEQIQRHTDSEENPTRRLTENLENLLGQDSEKDFNVDKLDGLLIELDAADPISDAAAFDAEAGLRRFHERLSAQEAGEGKPSAARSFDSSASQHPKHRAFKPVLIAAALATLLLMTTAQAFHLNLFDLFARWSSELFGYSTTEAPVAEITRNPLTRGEERAYGSVQEMMDEFGVTAPLFPTWVPERFGEPTVHALNILMGLQLYVDYSTDAGALHVRAFTVEEKNLRDTQVNADGADSSRINGADYYFMSDNRAEKVIWRNGEFECRISGDVTREELEQIVSSINKG